jgi:anti-sigma factor ChrR (cupin superfamily)
LAGRLGGPAEGPIEAAKFLIEAVPVDQPCQAEELMALIQDLIETAAVEIAGARHRRLGSHGKTPAFSEGLRLAEMPYLPEGADPLGGWP